mmetsp:Transcript_26982/g.104930  ORF Transcript_26982/g.104930 Transcript_26982/m.104930 type:complete len:249 (+) Transcript_26982:1123-1869(+)
MSKSWAAPCHYKQDLLGRKPQSWYRKLHRSYPHICAVGNPPTSQDGDRIHTSRLASKLKNRDKQSYIIILWLFRPVELDFRMNTLRCEFIPGEELVDADSDLGELLFDASPRGRGENSRTRCRKPPLFPLCSDRLDAFCLDLVPSDLISRRGGPDSSELSFDPGHDLSDPFLFNGAALAGFSSPVTSVRLALVVVTGLPNNPSFSPTTSESGRNPSSKSGEPAKGEPAVRSSFPPCEEMFAVLMLLKK